MALLVDVYPPEEDCYCWYASPLVYILIALDSFDVWTRKVPSNLTGPRPSGLACWHLSINLCIVRELALRLTT
jgi:hypothetical protein